MKDIDEEMEGAGPKTLRPGQLVHSARIYDLKEKLGDSPADAIEELIRHKIALKMLDRIIRQGDWDEAPVAQFDDEGNPIVPGEDDEVDMAACVQVPCSDLINEHGEERCEAALTMLRATLDVVLFEQLEGSCQASIIEVDRKQGSNKAGDVVDIVFPGIEDEHALKAKLTDVDLRPQLEETLRAQCHGAATRSSGRVM